MSKRATISIYIGTYTDGGSRGIYRLELDPVHGRLSTPVVVAQAVNPSFLAFHPRQRVLYAVSEVHTPDPSAGASLLAYKMGDAGELALINQEWSGGWGACFVSVNAAGTHAFVANYRSGSVAAFPIRADGGVSPASSLVQHRGSSVHTTRQTGPHAHSVGMAPGDAYVLAADLGADRLFVYRFDPLQGTLTPHEPPAAAAAAGAGPRHFAAHPSGDAVFVINELNSTIATYVWDGHRGTLNPRGEVSTLPRDFAGENTAAEVAVHPSGRFVYGSNRGHDSIAVFRVADDRTLTPVAICPTGGRTPRHVASDSDGVYLLAANQESDSLILFRIDPGTGGLVQTGVQVTVPSPVFVGIVH